MSTNLTVNNTTFAYPDAGDPKGWGEDATAWASEVTDLLSDLKGPNDILQTAFSIANNQSTFADVIGLAFDPGTVRSVRVEYSIYRTTSLTEVAESGQLFLVYKNTANTWSLSRQFFGDDSGIILDVTTGGQIQYKSSNLSGTSYNGLLKFRASTLDQ